ncbi:MAG TPA: recombinase family protein [Xanthomonadaceae bacterium]|jgi:DNA invertase Pin-like site-specific DNA recombinase|nr:recombinase family protein [Xanthomonadaceae bacterium]
MKTAIAYIRVSTQKQGKSGLGLEAQQSAIAAFAANYGYEVIDTYVEIETGKGADALATRPQLAAAIAVAQLTGATIVASKLDRITRDVHFGSGLFPRTDLSFKIADMPHADNFQINIMLSVAQLEREMISTRTKAALAAARERGTKLGSPTIAAVLQDRSAAFAASLKTVVEPMLGQSYRAIANALNAQGIASSTGGTWSAATARRLVNRMVAA